MDKKIINHFKKVDPVIFPLFTKIKIPQIEKRKQQEFFQNLCRSIISQQLSNKAAASIFARFELLFEKGEITPQALLRLNDQKIRKTGASQMKVKYLKDLARKVDRGDINLNKLDKLTDNEVISQLTKIKGIGIWTAEMFLLFSLGREDIFSHGDLGLRRAIEKLYKIENPTKSQIEEITIKWSPYRSYASQILWRSIKN